MRISFRWSLSHAVRCLPGIWMLSTLFLATAGPFYTPVAFSIAFIFLHFVFVANNFRTAWGVYSIYHEAVKHTYTNWYQKYCQETDFSKTDGLVFENILHVIVIPNYCESLETLAETLDILSSHSMAYSQYKICLAMEATEKDSDKKALMLISRFGDRFKDIVFTIHPSNLSGEIRGKSSNVSWAARQMSYSLDGNHAHVVVTVMDADTCFAEDYFTALTYYYATYPKETRTMMMFAPCIVFDRNAKDVPFIVRAGDNVWATSVMSNLYRSSAVKFPCSAYSLSMDLARAVGFWDCGPEAIGEDMHMYLKCYFATEGRVRIQPIYSPASQSNVQESGYFKTLYARYVQGQRHMWGSLDTSYTIYRSIMASVRRKSCPEFKGKPRHNIRGGCSFCLPRLAVLLQRVLEAHVLLCHAIMMIFITFLTLPSGSFSVGSVAASYLRSEPLHPYVTLSLWLAGWMRFAGTLPFLVTVAYYERYHQWVGIHRWRADDSGAARMLGKRPQLISRRTYWNLLDWAALPIGAVLFVVVPTIQAQLSHFWTDRLIYQVSSKPVLEMPPDNSERKQDSNYAHDIGIMIEAECPSMVISPRLDEPSLASYRADSGFFDFDSSPSGSDFSFGSLPASPRRVSMDTDGLVEAV
ncbi:uncharacterized protein BJ171DRAFT_602033 [Polychytrium aggregatum]|uniref:uncharacterized protein n=1 Tax=Polychytrium aggregatum TaxID=110093 RepID=UPI0022FDB440|nr:uncharacterized protein BJ171DRAFT_602033 [Polychytrium aggregatum]KAI9199259.1 hypothetical protein BJ171DRAFT_602033 [Polychytrium aggregatum]